MTRLVRPTAHLLDAAAAGDRALADALGLPVVSGWATFTGALLRARETLAGSPTGAAWGPRLILAGEPPELVGWGGFKGPPHDAAVELGYEVAAARRGRGIATAAVRLMLAEAFADPAVDAVLAHTLPEPNASNRVLEKAGFRFAGEARERDLVVWRYRVARDGLPPPPDRPGPP